MRRRDGGAPTDGWRGALRAGGGAAGPREALRKLKDVIYTGMNQPVWITCPCGSQGLTHMGAGRGAGARPAGPAWCWHREGGPGASWGPSGDTCGPRCGSGLVPASGEDPVVERPLRVVAAHLPCLSRALLCLSIFALCPVPPCPVPPCPSVPVSLQPRPFPYTCEGRSCLQVRGAPALRSLRALRLGVAGNQEGGLQVTVVPAPLCPPAVPVPEEAWIDHGQAAQSVAPGPLAGGHLQAPAPPAPPAPHAEALEPTVVRSRLPRGRPGSELGVATYDNRLKYHGRSPPTPTGDLWAACPVKIIYRGLRVS